MIGSPCHRIALVALEHALLVSLCERPASGLDLARRFDKSIGFFWQATHQQIYRVLHRMETDGWVRTAPGERRDKVVYSPTSAGQQALADWLAESTAVDPLRSDIAVKLRGASFGQRSGVLAEVARHVADHRTRLAHYETLLSRDYPRPETLLGQQLDQYLVLRGGILHEHFWITWLTEYMEAHS